MATSKRFQSLTDSRNFNVTSALAIITFAGVAGYFILATRAAGTFAAFEAESTTLSGNATAVADPTASAGQAIQFNPSGCPTGQVGAPPNCLLLPAWYNQAGI